MDTSLTSRSDQVRVEDAEGFLQGERIAVVGASDEKGNMGDVIFSVVPSQVHIPFCSCSPDVYAACAWPFSANRKTARKQSLVARQKPTGAPSAA